LINSSEKRKQKSVGEGGKRRITFLTSKGKKKPSRVYRRRKEEGKKGDANVS